MGKKLVNKVILITGGTSGIGKTTALMMLEEGAAVIVTGRNPQRGLSLEQQAESVGGKIKFVQCDVADENEMEKAMIAIEEAFPEGIDAAVNNASITGTATPIHLMNLSDWSCVIACNLTGAFISIKHEAKMMLAHKKKGTIVNVGSINSKIGCGEYAAYASSKHGLLGLSRSAAAELAAAGIRVNTVCPGVIQTPMHEDLKREAGGSDAYDNFFKYRTAMGRIGQPEEIARAIIWLCSDDCSGYMTGTELIIDGGTLAI